MVVLEHKVSVYNFADLKLLHSIETVANPQGLVALSSHPDATVLGCPGLHPGTVGITVASILRSVYCVDQMRIST